MDYLSYIVKVETEKILIGMQQPGIQGEKKSQPVVHLYLKQLVMQGFCLSIQPNYVNVRF